MKRLPTTILFIAVLLGAALLAYLFVLPELLAREARVTAQQGEAVQILPVAAEVGPATPPGSTPPPALNAGDGPAALRVGDGVKTNEAIGAVAINGGRLDLAKRTGIGLRRHHFSPLGGWQTALDVFYGQIHGALAGTGLDGAAYTLELSHKTLTARIDATQPAEFLFAVHADGAVHVALFAGSGTLSAGTATVSLSAGQGAIYDEGKFTVPVPWARIDITAYDPAARPVVVDAYLYDQRDAYPSNWPYLAPPGEGTLTLDLLAPYRVAGLALRPDAPTRIAVTLAEVRVSQSDNKPSLFLHPRGASFPPWTISTDAPMLVSPGQYTLNLAAAGQANLTQPVEVSLPPGGRGRYTLDPALFGGARLKVDTLDTNPLDVRAFREAQEGGEAVAAFKTGSPSPLLPQGRYVLWVRTSSLSARFVTDIRAGRQIDPVMVQFGQLRVNYTNVNAQGTPRGRSLLIALAEPLRIVGKPMTAMLDNTQRGDPRLRSFVLSVQTNTPITLPIGEYSILIDDTPDVIREKVIIRPGEVTTLDLKPE